MLTNTNKPEGPGEPLRASRERLARNAALLISEALSSSSVFPAGLKRAQAMRDALHGAWMKVVWCREVLENKTGIPADRERVLNEFGTSVPSDLRFVEGLIENALRKVGEEHGAAAQDVEALQGTMRKAIWDAMQGDQPVSADSLPERQLIDGLEKLVGYCRDQQLSEAEEEIMSCIRRRDRMGIEETLLILASREPIAGQLDLRRDSERLYQQIFLTKELPWEEMGASFKIQPYTHDYQGYQIPAASELLPQDQHIVPAFLDRYVRGNRRLSPEMQKRMEDLVTMRRGPWCEENWITNIAQRDEYTVVLKLRHGETLIHFPPQQAKAGVSGPNIDEEELMTDIQMALLWVRGRLELPVIKAGTESIDAQALNEARALITSTVASPSQKYTAGGVTGPLAAIFQPMLEKLAQENPQFHTQEELANWFFSAAEMSLPADVNAAGREIMAAMAASHAIDFLVKRQALRLHGSLINAAVKSLQAKMQ